jgi:hypothetical protein
MKIKSLLFIGLSAVVLSSCLKSKDTLGFDGDKGSIVSEIFDVSYYGPIKFMSLDLLPATETVTGVTLRVFAPRSNKPSGKVKITLVEETGPVTAAGYTPMPANAYSFASLTADVAAGEEVDIPLTIFKNNMNLSLTYGIGLKISTVSEGVISENVKSVVIGIGLKNRWDGRYSMTGTFVDYANSAFTYYGAAQELHLITTGPTSNNVFNKTLNGYGYLFLNAGAPTYYGSFGLVLNWNAATNAITSVTNYYGQPSGNGRSAELDPSGVNSWNPTTKQIKIKYWLNQPSVISGHRSAMDETWNFLGAR